MKWNVRFTEPAIEDVLQEIRYHKEQEPRRDQDFLASLRAVIEHITNFPEAAPLARTRLFKRRDSVREIPCGPYRLFYLVREDTCWVLAVTYATRHLPNAWKERPRLIP